MGQAVTLTKQQQQIKRKQKSSRLVGTRLIKIGPGFLPKCSYGNQIL